VSSRCLHSQKQKSRKEQSKARGVDGRRQSYFLVQNSTAKNVVRDGVLSLCNRPIFCSQSSLRSLRIFSLSRRKTS
jgi:hypothetical protein